MRLEKLWISAGLVAIGLSVCLAEPAHPARRGEGVVGHGAPAETGSIVAFVGSLREAVEAAPSRASVPAGSLQEALQRILPDEAGQPRCLAPFVLEGVRQSSASPVFAAYLRPVLAPPALARESVASSPDGAFSVHYTLDRSSADAVFSTDVNGDALPDYVEQIIKALTSSRDTIAARFGFMAPRNGSALDVYLANLGGGIDGYSAPAPSGDGVFIVLDSRLLGNDALLRAAVSHQLAHAILAGYAPGAPVWWTEATASWLEGAVAGSYAHYLDKMQAALEHAADGLASDDPRVCQGHLLWPAYIATLPGRETLVRQIWEHLQQQGETLDLWRATDDTLRTHGLTLEDAFADYSIWLLQSGPRSDGWHFAAADRLAGVPMTGSYDVYPVAQIQNSPRLSPMGAAFIRFTADRNEGGLRLRFEGDLPGAFQAQLLLTPRAAGAPLVRAPLVIDERGRGSIAIPWASFSEAVLVVGNVARSDAGAGYSFVARTEPTFPFELVSLRAEPQGDEVAVTWETQSENGMFGWILYRTESPREVPRRLNQFVIPAIGDGDGPVSYQYVDGGIIRGRSYSYKLVGITQDGLPREAPETRVDIPR